MEKVQLQFPPGPEVSGQRGGTGSLSQLSSSYMVRALPNGRDWNGELEFFKRLGDFPFMFEEESRGGGLEGG